MDKLVVASTRRSSGKTSLILGMAKAMDRSYGYMKPLGDRLLYSKKRLWDYDSALITKVLGLAEDPEDISIGFDHSKLRYMYNRAGIEERIREMYGRVSKDKDLVFIEGAQDMMYGSSLYLDAASLSRLLEAPMIVVVGCHEGDAVDDITYLKRTGEDERIDLAGVVINRVDDVEDFEASHMEPIEETGIKVLGIMPRVLEMEHITMQFLADRLFAKVVTGEGGLTNKIKNIFVGAMSASAAQRNPLFKKDNKLIITSGDRHELIVAALEEDTAGIVLSNNILPPHQILSKASDRDIPILLMPQDTFQVAKKVDDMERLLTHRDVDKLDRLGAMVRERLDLDSLMTG